MTIKWNRSEEGYCTSKCGRFDIEPLFIGRTTPQSFSIYYRSEPSAPRVQIKRYCDTQRDAKEVAADWLRRQITEQDALALVDKIAAAIDEHTVTGVKVKAW